MENRIESPEDVHRPPAEREITRRPNSLRRKGFDYSSAAVYFVTICTHERKSILGKVAGAALEPSAAGKIARECWIELTHHYGRLQLGALTVMPNHIHGVLGFVDPAWAGLKPAPTTRRTLSEVVRAFKTF
jgi:REP element-mobilizing transposase RayT